MHYYNAQFQGRISNLDMSSSVDGQQCRLKNVQEVEVERLEGVVVRRQLLDVVEEDDEAAGTDDDGADAVVADFRTRRRRSNNGKVDDEAAGTEDNEAVGALVFSASAFAFPKPWSCP